MSESNSDGKTVTVDEKRAQYEQMQFTVCENGYVNVCNRSHNDDSAHTYSVEVTSGEATGCSCPHHIHRDARCKHMIAVENNPIVVSSATAASITPEVATDGGRECDHVADDPDDCLLCELQEKHSGEVVGSEAPDMGGGETSGVDEL